MREGEFPISQCTLVWKNEKFSITKTFFRQSNSLVISLVKTLLSRNFCQKCVRLNKSQQFPHHSVWKLREISLTNFWQKFRESD